MDKPLVECVPNVSEGRDPAVISAIADAVKTVSGVTLLDVDPGKETNRTVITFAGGPEEVLEAAFRLVRRSAELIDMRRHRGAHARIGATDVCPFVPISGVTMDECAELSRRLGARIGEELSIPVYLYEAAASSPSRVNLADIRRGEYEGLRDKLADPAWRPDFGPAEWDEKVARTGATVIGARPFLIAYNVNLNTRDKKIASAIALRIREGGRAIRDDKGEIVRAGDGTAVKEPGMFRCVKAVGWYIPEYRRAQVSINFTNFEVSPPHEVFDACVILASEMGVRVTGSELVGLIPKEAMLRAGRHYLRKQRRSTGVPGSDLIETAIQSLGLSDLGPFDPAQKIIESRVAPSDGKLASMSLRAFADELSTDSPAPGGGSVAALMGALSAALVAMVGNLACGRKGFEEAHDALDEAAARAQALKDAFLRDIDRDTDAFNAVMEAARLPKGSEAEKAARADALAHAYREATNVPLGVLERCLEALGQVAIVAAQGNPSSLSDAAVAASAASAAAEGARWNVLINLPSLPEDERGAIRARADQALARVRERGAEIQASIEDQLGAR